MKKPFGIERKLTLRTDQMPWLAEWCDVWHWMSAFPTERRRDEALAKHRSRPSGMFFDVEYRAKG
jgi:hypothetical protein